MGNEQFLRDALQFYVDAGVDLALEEYAPNRLAKASPVPEAKSPVSHVSDPPATIEADARKLAMNAEDLTALHEILLGFEGCGLKRTATNTVFEDGNRSASIMFVGEAPGRDEDVQGKPFVGRSGQLLDRMLAAIGMDRTQVYIANIIPWRPPGNRTPTNEEMEICKPFIRRQIELVDPSILVFLGGSAAKNMLMTQEGILKLRGKWREYEVSSRMVPCLPTLHPAYLLRQPAQKRLAWRDFLSLREKYDSQSAA